jgi:multiple sugar transport system permease protein
MMRRSSEILYKWYVPLVFLAPWIIGFLVFTLLPFGASIYLSLTKYDLFTAPEFVGVDNYVRMLGDSRYLKSIEVTFVYVLLGVPLQLLMAFLLALVLNKGHKGLSVYRAVYYVPSLFGSSVAIALLWRRLFGNEGVFTQLLEVFGYTGPGWINSPDYANLTLILLRVWQFGSPMVIFLAALRQVPSDLYDSADIDGAGPIRRLLHITLPMITPVILFNVIMQMISAFQTFTQAYIVSGGAGGPSRSTLFYTLYLYQNAFQNFRMGYASAMAWALVMIIGAMTALSFLTSKRWVYYEK